MNYLLEDSRSQLINRSKNADNYVDQSKGKNRYQRRVHSRVANSVAEFNKINMNELFKNNILTVTVNVTGETDNYQVIIKFDNFLGEVHNQLKNLNSERISLRIIIRSLVSAFNSEDVYIHCSCLHPDTKIKLLDGSTPTIAEMSDRFNSGEQLYVYSVDEKGDFKPGIVEKVWITKTTSEFIKVTIDNEQEIITTPEHLYMLRDGSYKQAQTLTVGQSLMPLYFNVWQNGYDGIKLNSAEKMSLYKKAFLESKSEEEKTAIKLKADRNRIGKYLDNILSDGLFPTPELADKYRVKYAPKWDKCFSSWDELITYFELNHKITNIEYITLPDTPVYDIKVKDYENFLVDAGVILHNCPDWKYRFSYWSRVNDISSDINNEQTDNGKEIRNPHDTKGAGCKHTLLVLANNSWLTKVASVIYNYINYMEKHYQKLYADIIYPAIYEKEYSDDVQLSIDDLNNGEKELKDDSDEIDISNKYARTKNQFKAGNQSGIQFASKNDEPVQVQGQKKFNFDSLMSD